MELHVWEDVSPEKRPKFGWSDSVYRMPVLGGWIYRTILMRRRLIKADDVFTSMVFVPDLSSSNSETT